MLFTKYLHVYKINHDPTIPVLTSILEENSHLSCAKMWLVAFFIFLLEKKLKTSYMPFQGAWLTN